MKKLILILNILTLSQTLALSQTPATSSIEEAKTSAREIINKMLDKYPGLSISVGIGDAVIWSEGFGLSNVKPIDSMRIDHQIRYYSLSKSITGMALIKLMEVGKLDLEKGIRSYIPELPTSYEDIKVKHLISHTSGIRHYKKKEWTKISQNHCDNPKDALNVFINDPLNSVPGETYRYSSFNYVLLSHLIQEISGKGFFQFIQEELLAPNGISTIIMDQSADVVQEASYYDIWIKKRSRGIKAKSVNNSCKFGGGGLVGTAADLVKLHLAMLNKEISQEPFLNRYYQSSQDNKGAKTNYAFGLGDNLSTDSGVRYHSHTGSGRGANTVLIIYPESKLVITLLGNLESNLMNQEIGNIAKPFLDFISQN